MKYKTTFGSGLISLLTSFCAVAGSNGVIEAQRHENVTNAFLNPDKASLLPRVLIIGDSISIVGSIGVKLQLCFHAIILASVVVLPY